MQDLEHTVSVKDGDPAEKIVQMAGVVGADLIVMGRGKKENDLSGVTRQVLTAAQVPVILVDT
jgi:nucleotide-binding universal stress UspA family protein